MGDNRTLNTAAFKHAFDACAAAGGGYVEVPAGAFLTGRVDLQSNCYLVLQRGGIVQGSAEQADYGAPGKRLFLWRHVCIAIYI